MTGDYIKVIGLQNITPRKGGGSRNKWKKKGPENTKINS
jgi:hypothetical protein